MLQPVDIHTHRPADSMFRTLSTVGIHPYDADRADAVAIESVESRADEVDAIGEIGLDGAIDIDLMRQEQLFRQQLAIAQRYGKGVVIHAVRSMERVMNILGEFDLQFVVFHGFIGSIVQARRAIDRGYYLSFGERTFRSPKTVEALRIVPLSQLFVETDESQTALEKIYEQIAAVRGISANELAQATHENFEKITKGR